MKNKKQQWYVAQENGKKRYMKYIRKKLGIKYVKIPMRGKGKHGKFTNIITRFKTPKVFYSLS